MKLLTRQEEIVLLAIWRLKDNAYGVTIRELISEITGKYWSVGSIYVPLDKLTERGYVQPRQGEATKKRGGKSKKFYQILPEGIEALSEMRRLSEAFWNGLDSNEVRENG